MNQKIKVALVGVGYWGPNLVRNFLRIKNVEVVTCDLDKAKLAEIKKKHPQVQTTPNYDDVLRDKEVQAVVIATPVGSHYRLAASALKAEKHVLVEKPMTRTIEQAEKLMELAKKQKRILMVDHTFLFAGPVLKIKELIDNKSLGDLWYYSSNRENLGKLQPDVNVIWDLAVHDLAILSFIQNRQPLALTAQGSFYVRNIQAEIASINIHYPNKFTAYLNVSWLSPVKVRKIVIAGSKKMVVFDDVLETEKLKLFNCQIKAKGRQVLYNLKNYQALAYSTQEPLLSLTHDFLNAIKKNKPPITDGRFGFRIVQQLSAAEKSLNNNQQIKL